MPRYADGFLLAVPKRKLAAYRKISRKAGKIWKEHGALEYIECAGDDLKVKMGMGRLHESGQSEARRSRSCFPGSSISRAPTAIASTRR